MSECEECRISTTTTDLLGMRGFELVFQDGTAEVWRRGDTEVTLCYLGGDVCMSVDSSEYVLNLTTDDIRLIDARMKEMEASHER